MIRRTRLAARTTNLSGVSVIIPNANDTIVRAMESNGKLVKGVKKYFR